MAAPTMNPVATRQNPTAGRTSRVEALAAQVIVIDPTLRSEDMELILEVCQSVDVAAEFAALEGRTIAEALSTYFAEAELPSSRWGLVQQALKQICIPVANATATPVQLPVLPAAALKLFKIKEESATVAQLEALASSDPVLTARVLGTANSAKFGSRFQITRLADAIQRIGIPEARKTLIAACFWGLFASRPLQDLWEHSQQVADLASELARRCGQDPDVAYSAGLLHDIGRLVFLRGTPRNQALEGSWMTAGFPLIYAETLVRGRDHAARGADLLAAWHLPQELIDAVRLHHRPEACGKTAGLAHILYLAEDLTANLTEKATEDLWGPLRRQVSQSVALITPECIAEAVSGVYGQTLQRAG